MMAWHTEITTAIPKRWHWVLWLAYGLALLALLGQLAIYIDYAAALLRFPFDYDQGEGFELYDTVLHAQGQWPYRDSQTPENFFYTSIYPPFFHLMIVPLVWVFGPHLWTGRLVGFAMSLVAAAAVGWGIYRATGRRWVAVFAGLTFIASNYTFHIGPLFRQHMTMVAFEALAIVALAQVGDQAWTKRRAFWLGLGLLLIAGYTKQLALATVLAALTYLFIRGPRRAILVGLGLSAVAGGIFLAIDWATAGWWYTSIIEANINEFDVPQMWRFYQQWTTLHFFVAALAVVRLVYETYFTRLSLYALWFAFAVANGALSGKFGAGESYFVTATAATCIVAAIALVQAHAWLTQHRPRWAWAVGLAIPLLFLAQTRLNLHLPTTGPIYGPLAQALGVSANGPDYYDSQGYTQLGPHPTEADMQAGWQIVALACQTAGPVFSEEAAFMFQTQNLAKQGQCAEGKAVYTNPFPQLVMYRAQLFDPTQEIAMLQAKQFGLVIFRAQFYPQVVLDNIGANYQPLTEIKMNHFTYRLLVPKP